MAHNSQKFIARNRAARVQIEYDVELYGAEKKVQLPFVVGVLADLSGRSDEILADVADRKLFDIDIDNFERRMAAIRPRLPVEYGDGTGHHAGGMEGLEARNRPDRPPDRHGRVQADAAGDRGNEGLRRGRRCSVDR